MYSTIPHPHPQCSPHAPQFVYPFNFVYPKCDMVGLACFGTTEPPRSVTSIQSLGGDAGLQWIFNTGGNTLVSDVIAF